MEGITGHQGHRTTDEYGNPVQQGGVGNLDDYTTSGTGTGVTTAYGTTGGTPLGGGGYGHEAGQQQHGGGGVTGMLHRSGSSSSSSSEDDGMGGRRKKGIKDKIKEKLPGGHKDEQITSTTTPGAYGGGYEGEQGHEKKGVMEKIKDKFSGHND